MELPNDISKFVLSSVGNQSDAKYVLFGVPEHGGSSGLAYFEGSAGGPAALRKASQLYCAFHRTENGSLKTFVTNSHKPITSDLISFFDAGDKNKTDVQESVFSLLKQEKFPIIFGGDHSITYEALSGVNKFYNRFAVVYFDAHPDFRSSDKAGRKSYATVMYDSVKLPNLQKDKSIQLGISDIESEEFENLKKSGVNSLTSLAIEDVGIHKTMEIVKNKIGDLPVYVSVDLDVLDQVFAPAVATPSPCGLSSRELLFFLTELAKENVIGLDIMEHTPTKNDDPITSTVGARLLIEFIVRHNSNKKSPFK